MKSKILKQHLAFILKPHLSEQGWDVKSSDEGIIFYLPADLDLYSHEMFFEMTENMLNLLRIELAEVTRFDYFQNDKWLGGIFCYPEGYEGEIPDKR